MLLRALRPVLARTGRWDVESDAKLRALLEQDELERLRARERYEWFGQKARLVNLYRVEALLEHLREAKRGFGRSHELAHTAVTHASVISDPCRRGKCTLVMLETAEPWHGPRRVDDCCTSPDTTRAQAWNEICAGEIWRPYLILIRTMYEVGLRLGRRGKLLRVLALCLGETS